MSKMVPYAIPTVVMNSMVLGQFAGKDAQAISVMLALTALNQAHMVEVQAMPFGIKVGAKKTTHKDVSSGEPYGILGVLMASMLLVAVSAHQTALQQWLILE